MVTARCKKPRDCGVLSHVGSRNSYAARVAVSVAAASGTGPQIYAEKTGVGSVRTTPLVAQVNRRPEIETLCRELFVKLVDQLLEQRSADLQTNVRDALRQERVTLSFPIGSRVFHTA